MDAGEGGTSPQDDMDLEFNITPTSQAQQSLQGMAIGEKEKYEKELATCAQLLNQVRGYFGFDRLTHFKANPVTHNDLARALKCSSHVALQHAEAYGNAVAQHVENLEKQQVIPNKDAIKALQDRILELEESLKKIESRVQDTEDNVKANTQDIKTNKENITTIENMLKEVNERIAANDTNIQLNQEQYDRLRSEIWKSLSFRVLELTIDEHKRKLVIFGLENMGYNVQANNRQIYKSIIADANCRDQLPESCTLHVDFLGRSTQENQTKKSPAMVVTYNSEDLVFTGLKLKGALRGI